MKTQRTIYHDIHLAFTGAVLVLLYWIYKKFHGPA